METYYSPNAVHSEVQTEKFTLTLTECGSGFIIRFGSANRGLSAQRVMETIRDLVFERYPDEMGSAHQIAVLNLMVIVTIVPTRLSDTFHRELLWGLEQLIQDAADDPRLHQHPIVAGDHSY